MRAQIVARIYAETLLRLAERGNAIEAVDDGVSALAAALREGGAFAKFLEAPQIASEAKHRVLQDALGDKLHPSLVQFLALVVRKRRESMLGEIAAAWRELLDQRANRMNATVVTAMAIDEETRDAVQAALERSTGKTIVLEQEVDPALIGGVVLRFGDSVVDGSVRRRLGLLRNRLRTAHVASDSNL